MVWPLSLQMIACELVALQLNLAAVRITNSGFNSFSLVHWLLGSMFFHFLGICNWQVEDRHELFFWSILIQTFFFNPLVYKKYWNTTFFFFVLSPWRKTRVHYGLFCVAELASLIFFCLWKIIWFWSIFSSILWWLCFKSDNLLFCLL